MSLGYKDKELSRAFLEITRGYSRCKHEGQVVFVKHLGLHDQADIDDRYEEVYGWAQAQELPTEAERLKVLDEDGFWTKKDESKIQVLEIEIENMENILSRTIIKSHKEKKVKSIKEARKEISELNRKRDEMLHDTCESFAQARTLNYMVWVSFFKDEAFKEQVFTKEEFDELPREGLNELVSNYNGILSPFNSESIKKIAISTQFTNYFYLVGGNSYKFFNRKVLDLTFYQANLLSYGKLFKSVFENHGDIPDGISSDPDAILDFVKSKGKDSASRKSSPSDSEGGYSRVGATNQEMVDAGVSSEGAQDLHEIKKAKGGEMGWEDFASVG